MLMKIFKFSFFFVDLTPLNVMHRASNIRHDEFFQFIQTTAGDIEADILKAQGINNVHSLLRSTDLFSFFQLECVESAALRQRACFQLNDGSFLVKPVIRNNLQHCIETLRSIYNPTKHNERDLFDRHNSGESASFSGDSFAHEFMRNTLENMKRSKNNYAYSSSIRRFASALYVLGGKNAYEFLRINLPGALPSISTLEMYNDDLCKPIEECEFRFDELKEHLDNDRCQFIFASEDCTGAISRVQYDVDTNSFIGFCPKLTNGVPRKRQFVFDRFEQLEEALETIQKSTLVNVHIVQPISNAPLTQFLLSTFGTENTVDSTSIIRRWLYIHEQCLDRGVRIVGFASDADAKYLKAMKCVSGKFNHRYLRNRSLLIYFQKTVAVHLFN